MIILCSCSSVFVLSVAINAPVRLAKRKGHCNEDHGLQRCSGAASPIRSQVTSKPAAQPPDLPCAVHPAARDLPETHGLDARGKASVTKLCCNIDSMTSMTSISFQLYPIVCNHNKNSTKKNDNMFYSRSPQLMMMI